MGPPGKCAGSQGRPALFRVFQRDFVGCLPMPTDTVQEGWQELSMIPALPYGMWVSERLRLKVWAVVAVLTISGVTTFPLSH
jgi:hypothetical protein